MKRALFLAVVFLCIFPSAFGAAALLNHILPSGEAPTLAVGGDGNILPLDQWVSTSSPASAITQRTFGKALRLTGLNCAGNGNGGALTTTANGTVVCSDDDGGGGGGSGFSTTSANYWSSLGYGWSTTSANAYLNATSTFGTTSANAWLATKTTANLTESGNLYYTDARVRTYLDSLAKGFFYSTTSANYWASQGLGWSTTSASYFLTQNQGAAFSTTSANFWLNSSSTQSLPSCSSNQVVKWSGTRWNCASDDTGSGGAGFGKTWEITSGALSPTTTIGVNVAATSTLAGLIVTAGNVSASESAGGVINCNRGTSLGPCGVFYSNAGAGAGRVISIVADNTAYDTQALNVRSDSLIESALNVLGAPEGKGIGKIGSNGVGDADASGLSIDTSLAGFIGQGLFIKGNATGKLLNIRDNNSVELLTLLPSGNFGLASTSPSTKFSVHGGGLFAGSVFVGGNLTATGTLTLSPLTSQLIKTNSAGTIVAANGGDFFSTTSANAWSSLGYGWSTTSANTWSSLGYGWSTTSANAFLNATSTFSTTSANAWLNASSTQSLPGCSSSQVVKWSGSRWNCASDDTGGGGGPAFGQSWEINGSGDLAPTSTIDVVGTANIAVSGGNGFYLQGASDANWRIFSDTTANPFGQPNVNFFLSGSPCHQRFFNFGANDGDQSSFTIDGCDGTLFSQGTTTIAQGLAVGTTTSPANMLVVALGANQVAQLNDATNASAICGTNLCITSSGGLARLVAGSQPITFANGGTRNSATSNGTEQMRLTLAGALGVGTTNPTARLSVSGSFDVTGTSSLQQATSTQFFATIASSTQSFISDARVTSLLAISSVGIFDFSSAASFKIPNGTNPTADDPGEIAWDTTAGELIADDTVVAKATSTIWMATIASTSPALISGGLLKVPTQLDGYTITAIRCSVQGGTSQVIAVEDESTNSSEDITCTTSVTSDDGSITNATYTAGEEAYIDFGATSGAVDYVSISVFGTWTRQ